VFQTLSIAAGITSGKDFGHRRRWWEPAEDASGIGPVADSFVLRLPDFLQSARGTRVSLRGLVCRL